MWLGPAISLSKLKNTWEREREREREGEGKRERGRGKGKEMGRERRVRVEEKQKERLGERDCTAPVVMHVYKASSLYLTVFVR